MLAQRLPGILPPLSYDEMIELTKIYSISGLFGCTSAADDLTSFPLSGYEGDAGGAGGRREKPMPGEVSSGPSGRALSG